MFDTAAPAPNKKKSAPAPQHCAERISIGSVRENRRCHMVCPLTVVPLYRYLGYPKPPKVLLWAGAYKYSTIFIYTGVLGRRRKKLVSLLC